MDTSKLTVSPAPHVKDTSLSTPQIMWGVFIALIPAFVVSVLFFGVMAVKVTLVAILACLFWEYIIQRFVFKLPTSIWDGSAAVTGILLAFNVPSSLPWWMMFIGAFAAIVIGKMSFGGIGKNPFNPALVGRVFMLICFPVAMTTWPKPSWMEFMRVDAKTGATFLSFIKEGLAKGHSLDMLLAKAPSHMEVFLGQMSGSMGEISAAALIVGGIYLMVRKIISWHIPVSFLGSMFIFSALLWYMSPGKYLDPVFHLFTGGAVLAAIYMATDMVTSPMTKKGMILFGLGCGLLTMIIRTWGAYPEGASFAILIMNAFVPLINKYIKPRPFGMVAQ